MKLSLPFHYFTEKDKLITLIHFVYSLLIAWFFNYQTKDLIWSLWLSSLVVGLCIIIWGFKTQLIETYNTTNIQTTTKKSSLIKIVTGILVLISTLFMGGFVVFHFSVFHIFHGVFLNHFFRILDETNTPLPPNWNEFLTYYWPVMRNYCYFLPSAFWMQRNAFTTKQNFSPIGPYKNVLRMHFLIFFFSFFSLINLEYFLVYVIVYSFYFFPSNSIYFWKKKTTKSKPIKYE